MPQGDLPRAFSLVSEPSGPAFNQLVAFGRSHGADLLLVVRPGLGLSAGAETLLARVAGRVLSRDDAATAWPGTQLLAGTATVLQIRLDEQVEALVLAAARGLFDWHQPQLPEDLALVYGAGPRTGVLLGSVAHEHDAFLHLTPAELAELWQEAPALARLLR